MSKDVKHNFKAVDLVTLNKEQIINKLGFLPDWYTDRVFSVAGFYLDCIVLNKKLPSISLINPNLILYEFVKRELKQE